MAAKYLPGQRVRVKMSGAGRAPRSGSLDTYAGQTGEVTNYYWLSPNGAQAFYLYTVRLEPGHKEIVLYEDEIEAEY